MALSSSPTGYLGDILDQPRALRDTLAGFSSQRIPARFAEQIAGGQIRRVILTGMGSSYHAMHPLHQGLAARGIDAQMVETSELLYGLRGLLRADTLVLAASQSGRSAETVALIERRAKFGASFSLLGVTNTPGSPLAVGADACITTQAGEENTVSCKTLLATLLALAWLEPLLAGAPDGPVLAELESAAPAVQAYLDGLEAHVADLRARLAGVRDVFVAGRGDSLAAAGSGGLVIKESTHVHGEGMSCPAFRHGPMEMLSPETFVLVLEGSGPSAALNRRLYEEVLAEGAPAGLVSASAPEAVFRLPPAGERARPLLEILPVQMLTLALASLRGHEAGKFSRLTKVTTTE